MKQRLAFVGAVIAASLIWISASWSQEASSPAAERLGRKSSMPSSARVERSAAFLQSGMYSAMGRWAPGGDAPLRAKLAEMYGLANELRTANDPNSHADEKTKAELAQKLESSIAAVYDEDMANREQSLSQLEQRLKNLQTLLDRRRKAKSEIVQLQLKVLVNEASGLGFSSHGQFGNEDTDSFNRRMNVERRGDDFVPRRKDK